MYRESRQRNCILGKGCKVVFAPTLGHIPPDSGGWHRDLFSGSVADAIHPRSLDTLTGYDMRRAFGNSTEVPVVLPDGTTVILARCVASLRAALARPD
jgi:hypothetical protein